MPGGKEPVKQLLLDHSVGNVLDTLTPLVSNDILLSRKILLIELVDQVSHPIGLEIKAERELIGRESLEVVRTIKVGGAVVLARTSPFQQFEMLVRFHIARALKHHVLEQVSEACATDLFVSRADMVPQIDRDQW